MKDSKKKNLDWKETVLYVLIAAIIMGLVYHGQQTYRANEEKAAIEEFKTIEKDLKSYDYKNPDQNKAIAVCKQLDRLETKIMDYKVKSQVAYCKGRLLTSARKAAAARDAFEKAVKCNRRNYRAYLTMAEMDLKEKNYDKAVQNCNRAVSYIPKDDYNALIKAYYMIAVSMKSGRDWNRAKEYYWKVDRLGKQGNVSNKMVTEARHWLYGEKKPKKGK